MLASSTEGAQNVGCGGKSQRFRWQTHLAIDGMHAFSSPRKTRAITRAELVYVFRVQES